MKLNFKGSIILIDEDDLYLLLSYHFNIIKKGNINYLIHRKHLGYPNGKRKRLTVSLHRLIMNIWDKKIQVDHINGNGLDNRKCNLRLCTNTQNSRNHSGQIKQRKHINYKGTKKNGVCSTWSARITVNRKSIYLGSYKTEKDAALAYNNAAIKYFGEFARLNEVN